MAHTGFWKAFDSVRGKVYSELYDQYLSGPRLRDQGYKIVVTGHSRGGAVAALMGAYLRKKTGIVCDVYTYGAPRFGNKELVDFIEGQTVDGENNNYRITNREDPIPRMPPSRKYAFLNPEYHYPTGYAENKQPATCRDYTSPSGQNCNTGYSYAQSTPADHSSLVYAGGGGFTGCVGNDKNKAERRAQSSRARIGTGSDLCTESCQYNCNEESGQCVNTCKRQSKCG